MTGGASAQSAVRGSGPAACLSCPARSRRGRVTPQRPRSAANGVDREILPGGRLKYVQPDQSEGSRRHDGGLHGLMAQLPAELARSIDLWSRNASTPRSERGPIDSAGVIKLPPGLVVPASAALFLVEISTFEFT